MSVHVVTAEESSANDASAIADGIPSRALMRAAAFNAAAVTAEFCAGRLSGGVTVFCGAGNNGGDGWALAGAFLRAGVEVSVREVSESRTDDARSERADLVGRIGTGPVTTAIVIDAIVGTGSRGRLHGAAATAAHEVAAARERGATVVSLDLPSGVDADHGATAGCVAADLTISFGSMKRGALMARGNCGEIVVVDIGLPLASRELPTLVDSQFVRRNVQRIGADAHKGTRKSVAIIAGGANMGGAAILAATAALRSGVGLVQVVTDPANVSAMHTQIPEALVAPLEKAYTTVENWADAVLIGPGLGTDPKTREFIRDLVDRWRGPVVLDAGALSAFDGDIPALARTLHGRPAIITPHPGELARLAGCEIDDVLRSRFDIGTALAQQIGAVVLLKGTPTVAFDPDGERLVSAAGTPVLATGGSGDALSGIVATLLAQQSRPLIAAACAAWIHGRAGELVGGVRGYRLSDVLDRLPEAWHIDRVVPSYPVLARLSAVA